MYYPSGAEIESHWDSIACVRGDFNHNPQNGAHINSSNGFLAGEQTNYNRDNGRTEVVNAITIVSIQRRTAVQPRPSSQPQELDLFGKSAPAMKI
jgi:hypothetical protein